MDSQHIPTSNPYPMRHPTLPPVHTAVGIPPLQPTPGTSASGAHPLAHMVHTHPSAHHMSHHLPQPLPIGAIPMVTHHPHHLHSSPYYDQYAPERFAALQSENEKLRRENETLRAKLAEYDKERAKADSPKVQSRYWTPDEHERFLEALRQYGQKDVRSIAAFVGTRNPTQVRTHAQKYYLRKAREAQGGLHSARKRSMSESDLVRMGHSGTPPGSPVKREASVSFQTRTDTRMTDVVAPSVPKRQARASGLASPLSTSVISIPSMIVSTQPPQAQQPQLQMPHMPRDPPAMMTNGGRPLASSGKPPPAGPKLVDNAGINLLSLVASEHERQSVHSRN